MYDNQLLKDKGWAEIENIQHIDDLIEIANSLGVIKPHPNGEIVKVLTPNNGTGAVKGTLSNRHGYANFPYHSDTAFWSTPARYIVLGMFEKSECSTRILETTELYSLFGSNLLSHAKDSIFMINTINEKKYTSALFKQGTETGFRFDTSCMVPINNSAKVLQRALEKYLKGPVGVPIIWSGNKAVVIDNWNTLHARDNVNTNDSNRTLMRIYTGQKV